jgi:hypothetical protein
MFLLARDKRGKLGKFLSLGLTLFVLVLVFLASTVSAVKVNLSTDKPVYKEGSKIAILTASVDIEKNEAVPIRSLKLIINDIVECEFDVDGTESCDGIEIIPLKQGQEFTGDLYGKGMGYVGSEKPSYVAMNFGYGYGFNEEAKRNGMNGELKYEIKWNIENVPNGKYEARLEAYASNQEKEFTYTSLGPEVFHIQLTPVEKAELLSRVKAVSSDGDIESIGIYSNFAKERLTYQMDLRKAERYDTVYADGKISLYMHGELLDKTTATLNLDLDDFEIISFNDAVIELNAKADYTYKKTNSKDSKNNEFSIGTEDVHVLIENGIATMSSQGTVPFTATVELKEISKAYSDE